MLGAIDAAETTSELKGWIPVVEKADNIFAVVKASTCAFA